MAENSGIDVDVNALDDCGEREERTIQFDRDTGGEEETDG